MHFTVCMKLAVCTYAPRMHKACRNQAADLQSGENVI
jgi:hypothetical protein